MSKRITSTYPTRLLRWFIRGNTRCERCNRFGAETYHQHTCYVDYDSNIVTLCPECREENDQYWADMWSDYYSAIM